MASKFRVEVLTPEGAVFDEEVEMVSTRTTLGMIGIRARHVPLLGTLDPTELRLFSELGSDEPSKRYAQGEGYIQVSRDGVLVLVEEALDPDGLDVADLQGKLSEAESKLGGAESGTEEHSKAARDKRRWETFIAIAEGSFKLGS